MKNWGLFTESAGGNNIPQLRKTHTKDRYTMGKLGDVCLDGKKMALAQLRLASLSYDVKNSFPGC